jgi:hypothetical protein
MTFPMPKELAVGSPGSARRIDPSTATCLPKAVVSAVVPDGAALERLPRNRQPRYRAARRKALRAMGLVPPYRHEVWQVTTSALLEIPQWAIERRVPGLASFWLYAADARQLCGLDRKHGGRPTVLKAEYKRCELCNRPLLGSEAAKRNDMLAVTPNGHDVPCGPNCCADRQSKLWKLLGAIRAAA